MGMESNQVRKRRLEYADRLGAMCVVVSEELCSRKPRARPRRVGDTSTLGITTAAAQGTSKEVVTQQVGGCGAREARWGEGIERHATLAMSERVPRCRVARDR